MNKKELELLKEKAKDLIERDILIGGNLSNAYPLLCVLLDQAFICGREYEVAEIEKLLVVKNGK